MDSILEGLNEEQKKAVLHTEGPLLILAGAGSGKTRVITHRIAYLVLNKGVAPHNICALTFTNKAAAEMKERVERLMPNSHKGISIKTFHSLCLQILRSNVDFIDLESNFTVYDTSLQEALIKEVVKDLNLDTKIYNPSKIANQINHAKDVLILPDEFGQGKRDSYTEKIALVYAKYEERKKKNNALDFGDLILKTVLLFRSNEQVLKRYNMLWKYLMVDEYQDTNHIQYLLTKLLAGELRNVCVVGDDDQSIYSWRGADIRNILDFEKDYSDTFTVKLEENYRSTSNIIQAAGSIIKNNSERKDKSIFTNNPKGEKISFTCYNSEHEEANTIVRMIKKLFTSERAYSPFSIFYRTNAQSRYFEEALRSNNIPYKIFGGFRFFDRAEIKDLVAYLSVIVNPNDDTSLLRIINTPPRGIGDTTLEKLRAYSIDNNQSLLSVLGSSNIDVRKATLKKMNELHNKFADLREMYLNNHSASEITKTLLTEMGIMESYESEDSLESQDRIENIQQFVNAIKEYEESTEDPSLSEYLNGITLITSEENKKDLFDYVTLMTVHNSKGLEFDYVFLTGMEEGTFPHSMSMDSESEIEEERRLCYVAVTRARKKLYTSYCRYTRKYGSIEERLPSRFFKEVPTELFDNGSSIPEEYRYFPESAPLTGNRKPVEQKSDSTKKSIPNPVENEIKPGSKVIHKDYGQGKVLEVTGSGDNKKVKISFGFNQKSFLLAYTKLELIK